MSLDARVLPMGDTALLVETTGIEAVLSLNDAFLDRLVQAAGPWARVRDVVPAARTVLLSGTEPLDLAALAAEVESVAREVEVNPDALSGSTVEIPTTYDGEDLAEVARLTGLTPEEVVGAHTSSTWRVAFGGFAPGFAYLVGGDERLQVPRRSEPRTKVPPGAVALAGEYSAVYPRESPGGWQLIGSTTESLWDTEAEPPARLMPGMTVRFVDAGGDPR